MVKDNPPRFNFWRGFRRLSPFGVNLVILLLAIALSIGVGSVFIPPSSMVRLLIGYVSSGDYSNLSPIYATILFDVRFPHTALVCLTGAALAGSGAAYQGLFRNPLADPYLIGVASGAGLGAVAALALRWPSNLLGWFSVPIAAFVGATLTVFLVYSLASVNRSVPTTTLILAGVAVSSFATSLTSFIMLRSKDELHRALSWLLGGASMSGWQPVIAACPYILIGLMVLWLLAHTLNVMQFGEEQAQQLGVHVERAKIIIVLAASLTTAAAVSFSGLIGFIGLVIPHVARLLWGADHRRLLPLSAMAGGSALLLADVLARVLLAPQVLPVGIVTALAGAPFFLWLLRRAKSQLYW